MVILLFSSKFHKHELNSETKLLSKVFLTNNFSNLMFEEKRFVF